VMIQYRIEQAAATESGRVIGTASSLWVPVKHPSGCIRSTVNVWTLPGRSRYVGGFVRFLAPLSKPSHLTLASTGHQLSSLGTATFHQNLWQTIRSYRTVDRMIFIH
jgi:hypothetical protein